MFIFCFSKIAGEEDDVNLKRSNEEGGPWKLAKYVTGKVNWTSACPLNITCCRGDFRHQSKCKFAFCSYCIFKVEELFANEDNGGQAPKRTRRCRSKQGATDPAVHSTEGGKKSNKNEGGVLKTCGRHTLRDIQHVDFIESDEKWMQKKNKDKLGWRNIASNCGYCGKEF